MLSQKLAQMFLKVAKIISTAVFTLIKIFKIAQKSFWATFVSKFVAKNFKKSPNLVIPMTSN